MRGLRAGLLAGVVVGGATVAHVSAAGSLPGPFAMLALCVLVALACCPFLGREASPMVLVALTVGGQSAVHCALAVTAGHGTAATDHADAGHHAATSVPGLTEVVTHSLAEVGARPLMALLHLVAAVMVALWLAVGERALWALLTLARSTARGVLGDLVIALRRHTTVLHAVPRAPRLSPTRVQPCPQLPIWSRGPVRRGPPTALLPH